MLRFCAYGYDITRERIRSRPFGYDSPGFATLQEHFDSSCVIPRLSTYPAKNALLILKMPFIRRFSELSVTFSHSNTRLDPKIKKRAGAPCSGHYNSFLQRTFISSSTNSVCSYRCPVQCVPPALPSHIQFEALRLVPGSLSSVYVTIRLYPSAFAARHAAP